ncbi:MAG: hypothetical protein ACJ77M_04455, partial [Thermoleophilaceae bacterium]
VGRPALASLNNALPHLRNFAIDALPATKSSPATIDASLPFVKQARGLVSKPELRGLTADLVPTIPALAKVNQSTIPLLDENRSLSACTNNVLLPFAKAPIPDPDFPDNSGVPFYQSQGSGLASLSGETRLNDGNTSYIHVQTNAGPTSVLFRDPQGNSFFAQTAEAPKGVRPIEPDHRPNDRPGTPCETQQAPDMNAAAGPAESVVTPNGPCSPTANPISCIPLPRRTDAETQWNALKSYFERKKEGLPAVDPLEYRMGAALDTVLKQAGLKLDSIGQQVPDLSLKHPAKR